MITPEQTEMKTLGPDAGLTDIQLRDFELRQQGAGMLFPQLPGEALPDTANVGQYDESVGRRVFSKLVSCGAALTSALGIGIVSASPATAAASRNTASITVEHHIEGYNEDDTDPMFPGSKLVIDGLDDGVVYIGNATMVPAGYTSLPVGGAYTTIYSGEYPATSNVNADPKAAAPNLFFVEANEHGEINAVNQAGTSDLLLDSYLEVPSTNINMLPKPIRVYDSRSTSAKYVKGTETRIPLGLVPNSIAILNLTVAEIKGNGFYADIHACGLDKGTSVLNGTVGDTIAKTVLAPVDEDGAVCVKTYVADAGGVVLDEIGSILTKGGDPERVLDTRLDPTQIFKSGVQRIVELGPEYAGEVVAVNFTTTDVTAGPNGAGFISVNPVGEAMGTTSTVNLQAGKVTTGTYVGLANEQGQIAATLASGGRANVVVDVQVSFAPSEIGTTPEDLIIQKPVRIFDSRTGLGDEYRVKPVLTTDDGYYGDAVMDYSPYAILPDGRVISHAGYYAMGPSCRLSVIDRFNTVVGELYYDETGATNFSSRTVIGECAVGRFVLFQQ